MGGNTLKIAGRVAAGVATGGASEIGRLAFTSATHNGVDPKLASIGAVAAGGAGFGGGLGFGVGALQKQAEGGGVNTDPNVLNGVGDTAAEADAAAAASIAEDADRRRRALINAQNNLIKTTPLGARFGKLGASNTLSGV